MPRAAGRGPVCGLSLRWSGAIPYGFLSLEDVKCMEDMGSLAGKVSSRASSSRSSSSALVVAEGDFPLFPDERADLWTDFGSFAAIVWLLLPSLRKGYVDHAVLSMVAQLSLPVECRSAIPEYEGDWQDRRKSLIFWMMTIISCLSSRLAIWF